MTQRRIRDSDREVQNTNEDAQISKLSCHQLGYINDPFVQYFVRFPCRRSPLINRGYFARCYALNALLEEFLDAVESSGGGNKMSQVISLGAGFDSTWFNLKQNGRQPTKFIELDFAEVTEEKVRRIFGTPQLKELLSEDATHDSLGELVSNEYTVLPVDLRKLEDFDTVLKRAKIDPKLPTYVLSECVLVYLEPFHGASIVKHLGEQFTNSVFVIYEQINPNDAFGRQMTKNLEARGCPLRGLEATPTLSHQKLRFTNNNWRRAISWDLDTIYQTFIPKSEQTRISKLEIFDEFEEWHMIQEHYCICIGINDTTGVFKKFGFKRPNG